MLKSASFSVAILQNPLTSLEMVHALFSCRLKKCQLPMCKQKLLAFYLQHSIAARICSVLLSFFCFFASFVFCQNAKEPYIIHLETKALISFMAACEFTVLLTAVPGETPDTEPSNPISAVSCRHLCLC